MLKFRTGSRFNGAKMAQDSAKMTPKWLEEYSEMTPRRAVCLNHSVNTPLSYAQDGPRCFQMPPRSFLEGPRLS